MSSRTSRRTPAPRTAATPRTSTPEHGNGRFRNLPAIPADGVAGHGDELRATPVPPPRFRSLRCRDKLAFDATEDASQDFRFPSRIAFTTLALKLPLRLRNRGGEVIHSSVLSQNDFAPVLLLLLQFF